MRSSSARSRASRACSRRRCCAAVAQPAQDGLGHVHLRLQGLAVLGRLFIGQQHPDLRRAVSDGRQPQLQPHRRGVPQRQRQHTGRHALRIGIEPGGAAQVAQQSRASLLAVQQQRGVFATRTGIGAEQGFEPGALLVGARVAVAQGAGRAHRAAGAAADAQLRVDLDLILRQGPRDADLAGNGRGRAHVHAGVAADLLVAAVGAQLLPVRHEAGLLELPHQRAQLQQRRHITPDPSADSPADWRVARRPTWHAGPAPGRSVSLSVALARLKSIAPAPAQALTQSRCDLHRPMSIW